MKALSEYTGKELLKAKEKLEMKVSELCEEAIDAGWGYMTPTQIHSLDSDKAREFSSRELPVQEERMAVHAEIERRLTYSGTLRKIVPFF